MTACDDETFPGGGGCRWVACGLILAQATNPLIGTWELNVAKSKAPFKSGTTTVEAVGEGIRFIVDLEGTDGKKQMGVSTQRGRS